jgi:hypothetical protein
MSDLPQAKFVHQNEKTGHYEMIVFHDLEKAVEWLESNLDMTKQEIANRAAFQGLS